MSLTSVRSALLGAIEAHIAGATVSDLRDLAAAYSVVVYAEDAVLRVNGILDDANEVPAPPAEEAPAPKKRGRPAKTAEPSPQLERLRAERPAEPIAVAAEEAAAPEITESDVRVKLIEIVTKIGRDDCTALCQQFGGNKLSELNSAVYPEIYAAANDLLANKDV